MKFSRNNTYYIAPLNKKIDYLKWVSYINNHSSDFIWHENTEGGIHTLNNIDKVPVNFRERVLSSLNKRVCFKEYDKKKGYYNIHFSFNNDGRISVGFERTQTYKDLQFLLEMAKYLDAVLLLNDSKKIIDEQVIAELEIQHKNRTKKHKP